MYVNVHVAVKFYYKALHMLDVVHYLWYPSAFPGGKSVSVLNQGSKTPSDSLTNANISEIHTLRVT